MLRYEILRRKLHRELGDAYLFKLFVLSPQCTVMTANGPKRGPYDALLV